MSINECLSVQDKIKTLKSEQDELRGDQARRRLQVKVNIRFTLRYDATGGTTILLHRLIGTKRWKKGGRNRSWTAQEEPPHPQEPAQPIRGVRVVK